jgi:hypothetical protein
MCQGVIMLALSSWPPLGAIPKPDEDPGWFAYTMLFGSLGVIALGTGDAVRVQYISCTHSYLNNVPVNPIPAFKVDLR